MSNNIHNIKSSIGSLFTASTEALSVSTTLLADGAALVSKAVSATPAVGKAVLTSPFDATQGYLEQSGMTAEEAHAKAYTYLNVDPAESVQALSKAAGAFTFDLFKDDEPTK